MTFDTVGKENFRTFIPFITLPLCCMRGARVRRETGLCLSVMCFATSLQRGLMLDVRLVCVTKMPLWSQSRIKGVITRKIPIL